MHSTKKRKKKKIVQYGKFVPRTFSYCEGKASGPGNDLEVNINSA